MSSAALLEVDLPALDVLPAGWGLPCRGPRVVVVVVADGVALQIDRCIDAVDVGEQVRAGVTPQVRLGDDAVAAAEARGGVQDRRGANRDILAQPVALASTADRRSGGIHPHRALGEMILLRWNVDARRAMLERDVVRGLVELLDPESVERHDRCRHPAALAVCAAEVVGVENGDDGPTVVVALWRRDDDDVVAPAEPVGITQDDPLSDDLVNVPEPPWVQERLLI